MLKSEESIELAERDAAAWFVRLVANDLTHTERREYLAWLKASQLHVEALLDIYRYHGYVRRAKLLARHAEDSLPVNVINFSDTKSQLERLAGSKNNSVPGRVDRLIGLVVPLSVSLGALDLMWSALNVYGGLFPLRSMQPESLRLISAVLLSAVAMWAGWVLGRQAINQRHTM
ncbi:FecR/PupR family sigma factor regulator [Peristeroidobacter soli]|uniref:FecR/PupR family sigma factor regulator n=1 Tax=Peristeroidobacter soli TaxID=2497877 RepID=UPI001300214C|nr:FecR/PupR family sigma factor regulator [Peristeroidobacter soli]